MRIRRTVLVVAMVAGLLGACGGDDADTAGSESSTTEATEVEVDLSGYKFEDLARETAPAVDAVDNVFKPPYIIVKAGTAVTFRNDGRNSHNVYPAEKGGFEPVLTEDFEPGTEATITFDEAGDYPYYCTLHATTTKGMVGAVRVLQ